MKQNIRSVFWIMKQSKVVLPFILLTSILSGILSAISVYSAFISKSVIDAATNGRIEEVKKWLFIIAMIYVIRLILKTINSIASTYSSTKLFNQLQKNIYHSLTYSEWHAQSKYHSGSLLTRITSDTSTVSTVILSSLNSLISLTVTFISAFIALYYIDPSIAIFTITATPIFLLLSKLYSRHLKAIYNESYEQETIYRSFVQESIQNMMIIKTFCHEEESFKQMDLHHQKRFKINLKSTKFTLFSNIVFGTMSYAIYFCIYCFTTLKLTTGVLSVGSMTAMLQLYYKVTGPLSSFASIGKSFIGGIAAAERLIEIENLPTENIQAESHEEVFKQPTITFENVACGYQPDQEILKNVSFEVLPGETVALVGPSGEGKTTLIKLLLSLLPIKKGEMKLTEQDYSYPISHGHRHLISYVPQGNTLFSGTIRENITFGSPNATEKDIINATKAAYAWDFINQFEHGLDTVIGEKGLGLSEGQAQRIAIARAFLRKKPILILDEATSALDEQTELNILDSVKNLSHHPTCLIITHRPAALDICDRKLSLKSGMITQN